MKRFAPIMIPVALVTVFFAVFAFIFGESTAVFSSSSVMLPVIMYHSVSGDGDRVGKYTVTADTVASDMEYLISRGYETVTAAELIAWAEGGGSLPEKPVLLTFDDGFSDNLSCLLPVLKKTGAHGIVAVVGSYTEAAAAESTGSVYSYLAQDDIHSLWNSGFIEIANHSYDMHGTVGRLGIRRGKNEEFGIWARAFSEDTVKNEALIEAVTGQPCEIYAYPYGYTCEGSDEVLAALGYRISLTCEERINRIEKGEPYCLMSLGRFNRSGLISTASFMKKAGIE